MRRFTFVDFSRLSRAREYVGALSAITLAMTTGPPVRSTRAVPDYLLSLFVPPPTKDDRQAGKRHSDTPGTASAAVFIRAMRPVAVDVVVTVAAGAVHDFR